jgi:hypothetical protein
MQPTPIAKLIALTAAAVLLLSACTSPTPEGEATGAASSTSAATSPSDSSSGDATSSADAEPFDADAAVQAQLDGQWEMVLATSPDAVRPTIEMIRYVSGHEWAGVMEGCMHDLGWPDTKATPDGGLDSGRIENSQVGARDLAMYTCSAKYPIDPKYSIPLTNDELSELYDYLANELQPCLEEEGYEVPDAPSRETFIESYTETGGWNLYENVFGGGQDEWYAINEKCPQVPDGFNE